MLTRSIRLVSLPMLALLLAIPAVAHAAPDTGLHQLQSRRESVRQDHNATVHP